MKNNDFALTLSSDLFRLKKLRSIFVALIMMFLLIFLTFAVCWIGSNLANRIDAKEGTLNADGVFVDENGDPVVTPAEKDAMLRLFDAMNKESLMSSGSIASIEFFMMIIICIFIGKDFSNGTVRLMISRGTSRVRAFFSKWTAAAILVAIYSLFALVVSGILFSFKGVGFTGNDFGILMRCFFLEFLVNLSTMSIFLMIAFLCRSSGSSLGVSIGLYIVLEIALSIISTVTELSGGNTAWTLFMPFQQMAVAASSETPNTTELCAVIIMPIVYLGLSIGVGLTTFLKRDVK